MPVQFTPEFIEMVDKAEYMWFTTVREDGTPQPTPVWFLRENDTFLIYSVPEAQKIRNIRHSNKVALNFNDDQDAEHFVVIMGEAVFDESVPPVHQNPAYVAKYTNGLLRLGWTPEYMGANSRRLFASDQRASALSYKIAASTTLKKKASTVYAVEAFIPRLNRRFFSEQ